MVLLSQPPAARTVEQVEPQIGKTDLGAADAVIQIAGGHAVDGLGDFKEHRLRAELRDLHGELIADQLCIDMHAVGFFAAVVIRCKFVAIAAVTLHNAVGIPAFDIAVAIVRGDTVINADAQRMNEDGVLVVCNRMISLCRSARLVGTEGEHHADLVAVDGGGVETEVDIKFRLKVCGLHRGAVHLRHKRHGLSEHGVIAVAAAGEGRRQAATGTLPSRSQ